MDVLSSLGSAQASSFKETRVHVYLNGQDPTFVPTLTGQKLLEEQAHCLQYLHAAIDSTSRFYIGRYRDCRYFTANSHWLPNVHTSRFRCPACGRLYRPWIA